MADHTDHTNHTNTTYRETRIEERRGGTGTLAFVVGGLVVAVVFIVWLFSGGDVDVRAPATTGDGGGDVNVTIDGQGGAAGDGDGAPVDDGAPVPADDPAAPTQ